MYKKFLGLVVAISLITTTFLTPAGAAPAKKTFTIAFRQEIPSDYDLIISKAGGQVLRVLPEVSGLEVQSDNPCFLDNLKMVKEIQAADAALTLSLNNQELNPVAAQGQPVTDIPQGDQIHSYWDYQWDIQRVTHNGDSYALETGGVENLNGTVIHKATVGIIDSGIDLNHPDLKSNIIGGQNFVPAGAEGDPTETGDPNDYRDRLGHGTHIAGLIAANGKLKGIGPNLGIRAYRIFSASGNTSTGQIIEAILQGTKDKVDVINMSVGGFDCISRYTYLDEKNAYHDVTDALLYRRAIQYAVAHNVTVVVAAGNESLNLNNPREITNYLNQTYGYLGLQYKGASRQIPGQIPGVITVSSSNQWSKDKIAFYSNYGSRSIDVAAPGGDNGPIYDQTGDLSLQDFHYHTLSTYPTYLEPYYTSNLRGYALLQGTSMAAPKVAGIAGVIKAHNPELTPAQVTALIQQTAVDLGKPGTDALFGAGEANIYTALTGRRR
ncbi:subtilisin-like serine protease [Desulfosporosinus orientis DSM 765]|uniref:Subtilisin-like serine protease n=1 Tax=Desulfosporosinus orientis (strain ATCC 19365 / DSM 765 / NCIMB 8382 / VKM B-1628 / Singapore I) TaxID=768706 RepID=G7W733_DESOD|nr:S8 family serine peptidase [Desulfosporosinus orientis]AET70541.1 subtilisin-like serine protease [Desulfosporosinus orientis DSM 765]